MTLDIHDPRYAVQEQAITDERVRRIIRESRHSVKFAKGKVVGVDLTTRPYTCAALIEGATVASPGIQFGEHVPQVGDQVLVAMEGLAGRRWVVKIISRLIPTDYLNVMDRGAVTTRGVDNRVAFNEAIEELNDAGGGILRVPIGTFDASKIAMRPYVILRGDGYGSVLRLPDSTDGDVIKMVVTNVGQLVEYAGIEHLRVDGNKANQDDGVDFQQFGISIFPSNYCWVDHVWIHDTQRGAIYLGGGSSTEHGHHNRATDNWMWDIGKIGPPTATWPDGNLVGRSGIVMIGTDGEVANGPVGSIVSRNHLLPGREHGCLEHAIKIYGFGDGSVVADNVIEGAYASGIYVQACSGVAITGNTARNGGRWGIFVGDIGGFAHIGYDNQVVGNTVEGSFPLGVSAGHGIVAINQVGAMVNDNTCKGNDGIGIYLYGAPGSTANDNRCNGNGTNLGGARGYPGIMVVNSPHSTINDNVCKNNGTAGHRGTGIELWSTSEDSATSHCTVVGNNCHDDAPVLADKRQEFGITTADWCDYNTVAFNETDGNFAAGLVLVGDHNVVPARVTMDIGPFVVTDLTSNGTERGLMTAFFDAPAQDILMERAGRIVGMRIVSNEARTAGTASAFPWVNAVGWNFAAGVVDLDATNTTDMQASVPWEDGRPFAAGDTIGASVVAVDWAPITADMVVFLTVSFEDVQTSYVVPRPIYLTAAGGVAGYQPLDSDLTAIAAMAPANNDVMQRKAGAWANRTIAQLLVDLAAPGTTFQPLDADLTAIAALATTSIGRSLLAGANAAALRTILALGTVATLDSDTDTLLVANSDGRIATQKAVKAYVDTAVVGLLDFKGSTDASANPNYPAASKGDAYAVSVAGKVGGASGKSVDVGDVYVASADNAGGTEASVGTSWFVLEHNLTGALLAANNLSDLASAATARTNLGLAIGTNVQAWDADLDALAAGTAPAVLSLPSAASPAQTAEGSAVWDSDDDKLTIGDGASRRTMMDEAGTGDRTAPAGQTLLGPMFSTDTQAGVNVFARKSHTSAAAPQISGLKSRGSASSPAVVASGDGLYTMAGFGFDGTNYVAAALWQFFVDAAVSTGVVPSRAILSTMSAAGVLTERLRVDSAGLLNHKFGFARSGVISPAALTANTDNWAPTGIGGAYRVRASTDASRNLTGIVAEVDGVEHLLVNVGAFDLVLVHDATSTAANRFLCPNSANLTLNPNDSVRLSYDATAARWRAIGT